MNAARDTEQNMQTGTNYEATRNLSTTDIAKLVRKEIAALMASDDLPRFKVSVKTSYYAGGSSISVSMVSELPFRSVELVAESGRMELRSTEICRMIERRLEAVLDSFNRKDIDSQSDYYNVRFWGHVSDRSASRTRECEELQPMVGRSLLSVVA